MNVNLAQPPARASSPKRLTFNERHLGLALAIALHAIVIWGLLQVGAVRQLLLDAAPIMVRWIDPPQTVTPPKPLPVAIKPVPTNSKPVQPVAPSVLATPPTPVSAPQAATVVPPKKIEPAPIITAPAAPIAVTAPIFSAAYLRNPPPAYPPQSKRRNEAGMVLLRVYVNAEGAAEKIELQTSSGWPRLDQAAQDTVRSWRFIPAKQDGQAVAAWVIVPINFVLEG